jgi:trehalose 6-phosphate phosphatase
MNYLFTPNGIRLLDAFCFKQSLFAFDFDGTLAPIVRSPNDARASARSSVLLGQLTQYAPTAIISGRGLTDLRARITVTPRFLIGNHGLEGLRAKNGAGILAKETSAVWREKLEPVLSSKFTEGVELEDKTYSLAIHYRKTRNKQAAREAIEEAIDQLRPLPRIILGKQVYNLIPQGAPHKGVALTELMTLTGTSSALFIGDDDTDEDVFSLPDDRIVGIRVGYSRKSQAQYFIRRQSEVTQLLERLVDGFESLVRA